MQGLAICCLPRDVVLLDFDISIYTSKPAKFGHDRCVSNCERAARNTPHFEDAAPTVV